MKIGSQAVGWFNLGQQNELEEEVGDVEKGSGVCQINGSGRWQGALSMPSPRSNPGISTTGLSERWALSTIGTYLPPVYTCSYHVCMYRREVLFQGHHERKIEPWKIGTQGTVRCMYSLR